MLDFPYLHFYALYEAPSEFRRGLPPPVFKPGADHPNSFDYSSLQEKVAVDARAAADEIRAHFNSAARSMIAIGRALTRIKDQLGHGKFRRWLTCEFGMPARTAQDYMALAAWLPEDKYASVAYLRRKTLYSLSARSTPNAVREAVLREISEGTPLSDSAIQARIEAAKPTGESTEMLPVAVTVPVTEREPKEVQDTAGAASTERTDDPQVEPVLSRVAAELSPNTRCETLDLLERMSSGDFVRHLRASLESPDDAAPFPDAPGISPESEDAREASADATDPFANSLRLS